jgi:hypothetical protein
MKRALTALATLTLLAPLLASAKDLSNLYDVGDLEYWKARYEKSTRKIFDQIIWPVLSVREKQRLHGLRLDFPLLSEGDQSNPLNYYAPGDGRVVLPVLSLKFLDDLCTAYAWLQTNGYGLETISEYTAMLAYRDFPQGRYPAPLPALHIPDNALNDQNVNELSLGHFVTARTFILLHELGHAYYGHRWRTLKESRGNEEQADRFAATVMARTPLPPLGMLVFFMADAHWSNFPVTYSDKQWQEELEKKRTHPLTGQRLHTLAQQLQDPDLARALDAMAAMLDDPEVQGGIVATAKATDESMLAPRRPGELPRIASAVPETRAERLAFDGRYTGIATQNGEPTPFPIEVMFQRSGKAVTGRYSFGLGVGQIKDGFVDGNTVRFQWEWSGNYGRAALRATSDGGAFSGTWGYRESETNAGSWNGQRSQD